MDVIFAWGSVHSPLKQWGSVFSPFVALTALDAGNPRSQESGT